MPQRYLNLVLHAHLPYVNNLDNKINFDDRWLFEAITESYLPLLDAFQRLERDCLEYKLTFSFSPTLLSMLLKESTQEKYISYLKVTLELIEKEYLRNKNNRKIIKILDYYHDHFEACLNLFQNQYQGDLLKPFKELHAKGHLELITTFGTHPFLPIISTGSHLVESQLNLALNLFEQVFSFLPKGIWLPECGYYEGLDKLLRKYQINYTFLEAHGILAAAPRPKYGVYAPTMTEEGLSLLARDPFSAKEVWSKDEGYPGNEYYREFHKDIGYELDHTYLKNYINPDGSRIATGLKYWRVTGKTDEKALYDLKPAKIQVKQDAQDFVSKKVKQIATIDPAANFNPLITTTFDAELFGHWWHEGPLWLEEVFRYLDSSPISAITPTEFLENRVLQMVKPNPSSWGSNGYNDVWLDDSNKWMYPPLNYTDNKLKRAAVEKTDSLGKRVLKQATKELMLAQSSDWAFMIKNDSTASYGENRFKTHLGRCNYLLDNIDNPDLKLLRKYEIMDDIFPEKNE